MIIGTNMDKNDELFKNSEVIRAYFSDDEKQLDNVLNELSEMQDKLKELINNFIDNPGMRGTQKVLSDQIANFISIQTERQSVLKDKRAIKENSLNIAIKTSSADDSTERDQILNNLVSMIKNTKQSQTNIVEDNDMLDIEIQKRLEQEK